MLPGARKFTELGLRPGKEIADLPPVDRLARETRPSEGEPANE